MCSVPIHVCVLCVCIRGGTYTCVPYVCKYTGHKYICPIGVHAWSTCMCVPRVCRYRCRYVCVSRTCEHRFICSCTPCTQCTPVFQGCMWMGTHIYGPG